MPCTGATNLIQAADFTEKPIATQVKSQKMIKAQEIWQKFLNQVKSPANFL